MTSLLSPTRPSTNIQNIEREIAADRALGRLPPAQRGAIARALKNARIANEIVDISLIRKWTSDQEDLGQRRAKRESSLSALRQLLPVRLRDDAEQLVVGGVAARATIVEESVRDALLLEDIVNRYGSAVAAVDELLEKRCADLEPEQRARLNASLQRWETARDDMKRALSQSSDEKIRREFESFDKAQRSFVDVIVDVCPEKAMPSWWRPYWDWFTGAVSGIMPDFAAWFDPDTIRKVTLAVYSSITAKLEQLWNSVRPFLASAWKISKILFEKAADIFYSLTKWQVVLVTAALTVGTLTYSWLIQSNTYWLWPLISMADVLCSLDNYGYIFLATTLGARYLQRKGASWDSVFKHIVSANIRLVVALGSYCLLFRHLQRRLFPFRAAKMATIAEGEFVVWADLTQLFSAFKALDPRSDASLYVRGLEGLAAWKLNIPYLDEFPALEKLTPEELGNILDSFKGATSPLQQLLQHYLTSPSAVTNLPAIVVPESSVAGDVAGIFGNANLVTQYYLNLHANRGFINSLEETARQQGPLADLILDSLPSKSQVALGMLVALVGATAGAPAAGMAAVVALLRLGSNELDSTPLGPMTPFLNASQFNPPVGFPALPML